MRHFLTMLTTLLVFAICWQCWPDIFVFTHWGAVVLTTIFYIILKIVLFLFVIIPIAFFSKKFGVSGALLVYLAGSYAIIPCSIGIVHRLYPGFHFNGSFWALMLFSTVLWAIQIDTGKIE